MDGVAGCWLHRGTVPRQHERTPTMTTIAAPSELQASVPQTLEDLRQALRGSIVTPADAGYDEARQIVSIAFDRHPTAIIRAQGTEDVALAVRFARSQGLPFAVRSGGHSVAGHSVIDGTLLIDMGGMRGISIDPVSSTAVVQPGVTSDDLGNQAVAFGLSLSTGDTSTVGIGGLTVGGGIGWMARKHGLTIDNLLEATVVTSRGEVLRAAEDEHPDLFWAIRGGGGNFGILTELRLRLWPNGVIRGGAVVLPASREVLRGYLEYTPRATEDLTTIAFLMQAPPAPFIPEEAVGQLVLIVVAAFTGPADEADAALAPIRALAEPIVDTVDTIPYPAIFAYTAEAAKRHGAAVRSMFADDVSDEQLDAILGYMAEATSPFNMVQFRGLGGAVSKVPAEATAFVHRDTPLMVTILGLWYDPEDDGQAHRKWAADLWAEIAPASRGVYVNFLQDDGETRKREAYLGRTFRRLQEVKAKYDPENVFRFNQNIVAPR